MRKLCFIFLFLLCGWPLFFFSIARAQITMTGGRGLVRIHSAHMVKPGDFYVNAFALAYDRKTGGKLDEDYTLNVSLTVGLLKNLELHIQFVPYQDDQVHIWGPPGDIEAGIKMGFPLSRGRFLDGAVKGFFVFPTAKIHNVPYEPYSTDAISWGIKGFLTLDLTRVFFSPLKLHLNLGYLDHDIRDKVYLEKIDQLIGGLGIKLLWGSTVIFTEFSTEQFFRSRKEIDFWQNSARLTPGVVFIGPKNLIFNIAADIDLSSRNSLIPTDNPYAPTVIKDYADWKLVVGMTYYFSFTQYFKRIAQEKKRKKAAEEEQKKLMKIKEKRAKAEEELQKMKEVLEKKKKENP